MSDTENNNNHDKIDDARPASPLRFGHRKRPASADLDGDIIEEDDSMHFKRGRHPSAEVLSEHRNSFDYLPHHTSGNSVAHTQQASADYEG